jgi:hypothetical protein
VIALYRRERAIAASSLKSLIHVLCLRNQDPLVFQVIAYANRKPRNVWDYLWHVSGRNYCKSSNAPRLSSRKLVRAASPSTIAEYVISDLWFSICAIEIIQE